QDCSSSQDLPHSRALMSCQSACDRVDSNGSAVAEEDIELLVKHVQAYHGDTVLVSAAEGKGRILLAACEFEPGQRILLEYPLVQVAVNRSEAAYAELIRMQEEGALEFAPFFYWAALCSLTDKEIACARCQAWPSVPSQTQAQALRLHAPEESCQVPSAPVLSIVERMWEPEAGPDPLRLERLLQVWIHNSFDQGSADDALEAGAMYLAASMMSHSCNANAAWHLDEADSFMLHARGWIEQGDEITIPYLGPFDLCLPTCDRRAILSATKGFLCRCERCAAPLDAARSFTPRPCWAPRPACGRGPAGGRSSTTTPAPRTPPRPPLPPPRRTCSSARWPRASRAPTGSWTPPAPPPRPRRAPARSPAACCGRPAPRCGPAGPTPPRGGRGSRWLWAGTSAPPAAAPSSRRPRRCSRPPRRRWRCCSGTTTRSTRRPPPSATGPSVCAPRPRPRRGGRWRTPRGARGAPAGLAGARDKHRYNNINNRQKR
ncbi:unnamed protein product, partial [Prorocentrum cordatum]